MDAGFAVDVRGGGGFFDDVDGVVVGPEGPELALKTVDGAVGGERVDGRRVDGRAGAAGFGFDFQAGGAGDFGGGAVVGIDDDFAEGFAVVEEEAGGRRVAADTRAEDGGEVGREIVAAAAFELGGEDG